MSEYHSRRTMIGAFVAAPMVAVSVATSAHGRGAIPAAADAGRAWSKVLAQYRLAEAALDGLGDDCSNGELDRRAGSERAAFGELMGHPAPDLEAIVAKLQIGHRRGIFDWEPPIPDEFLALIVADLRRLAETHG